MPESLNVNDLKRPGFDEPFYGGVLEEVVPPLIESGRLTGKKVRGKWTVLADDAFQRILQLGIEPLIYGQQGFAFVAIDAPIEQVAQALQRMLQVSEYRPNQKVFPNGFGTGPNPPQDIRPLFLVKPKASNWIIVVICMNWYRSERGLLGQSIAKELSKKLKTRAVIAFDDDVSGSWAEEWKSGKLSEEWSTQEDGFYLKFYERDIAAPDVWPSVVDGKHALMSRHPQTIERVDILEFVEAPKKPPPAPKKPTKARKTMTVEDALRQFADALRSRPPFNKSSKKRKSK